MGRCTSMTATRPDIIVHDKQQKLMMLIDIVIRLSNYRQRLYY